MAGDHRGRLVRLLMLRVVQRMVMDDLPLAMVGMEDPDEWWLFQWRHLRESPGLAKLTKVS